MYYTRSAGSVNNGRVGRPADRYPGTASGDRIFPDPEGPHSTNGSGRTDDASPDRSGHELRLPRDLRPHGGEHGLHPGAVRGRPAVRRGALVGDVRGDRPRPRSAPQPVRRDRGGHARDARRIVDRVRHRLRRADGPWSTGPGKVLLFRPDEVDRAHGWFERHGDRAVLVARVVPVVRAFISLPAGVARMRAWRFTLYTLIGALTWDVALTVAGYYLGESWRTVERVHGADLHRDRGARSRCSSRGGSSAGCAPAARVRAADADGSDGSAPGASVPVVAGRPVESRSPAAADRDA